MSPRRGRRQRAVLAVAAVVGVVAAVSVAVIAFDRESPREVRPSSVEDVVVEVWWRESVPNAQISGCRNTGVRDELYGGDIWACELWYVDPSRSDTVCVSIEEHVVQRRLRRGQGALPRTLACE